MLHGFEKQTAPLSEKEKILVPILIDILKDKHGIAKAITSEDLCKLLFIYTLDFDKCIKLTGARIRKMINYIRTRELLPMLIASSKGYYLADTPVEIREYIRSLMGRESAIRNLRLHVKNYLRTPAITQQLRLNI